MPSQRPFFLSTFFAAFRQQPPSSIASTPQQPANKHTTQPSSTSTSTYQPSAGTTTRGMATAATTSSTAQQQPQRAGGIASQLPRPHASIPIPGSGRRRGSDSSSEGFRDVRGADKWYIGGRTAGGEEKYFKLGVVRRVRSGDRLSLDRLSL